MIEFVSEYLAGTLSESLHDLTLRNAEKELLSQGEGSLFFKGPHLTLAVCGKTEQPDVFTSGDGYHVKFTGRLCQRDWSVTGEFAGSTRTYCDAAQQQAWEANIRRVSFDWETADFTQQCRFIGVLCCFPGIAFAPQNQRVEEVNKHFGDSILYYQQIEFSVGDYSIAIRHRASRAEVAILLPLSATMEEIESVQKALLNSLGLRWGFELEWLAVDMETQTGKKVVIFPWTEILSQSDNWCLPPLFIGQFSDGTNERILQLAMEFFLEKDRVPLDGFLNAVWRSAGSLALEIREASLGAAIEGLAQEILKRAPVSVRNQIGEARLTFEECKRVVLSHVDTLPDDIRTADAFRTIRDSIHWSDFFRAKAVLARAASTLGFSLSAEELKAWGNMRNHAAHGTNILDNATAKRLTDFNVCVGILNKFALALIGYEGLITDYGNPAGQPIQFKCDAGNIPDR